MFTLTHREVGSHVHVLNYSLGELQSFELSDGRYLLANLRALACDRRTTAARALATFLVGHRKRLSSRTFRAHLMTLGMHFRFPTMAVIEITRRCLMRCSHCYIPPSDLGSPAQWYFDTISPDRSAQLFDSLARLGVFLVVLTGGEVFLSPNLRLLLRQLRDRGFVIELLSSLQLLPPWFINEGPIAMRIGRLQASVYAVDAVVHDGITGVPGSLDTTLRHIERLRDAGFDVEVATPLMRANFAARMAVREYCSKRGLHQVFSWPIVNPYYGGARDGIDLNMTREQFRQFCREQPPGELIPLGNGVSNAPLCPAGRATIAIAANGDVFPCSQFPKRVGTILQDDIADVYRSPRMKTVAGYTTRHVTGSQPVYNYCIGNNWSDTGTPFEQSAVVRGLIDSATDCLDRNRGVGPE